VPTSCSCTFASAERPEETPNKARDALAQVLVVSFAITRLEENVEHLVHVDAEEAVRKADCCGEQRQDDRLADGMRRQMLASESGDLQVELDDERAVQPAEDADEDEEAEFEKVPIPVEAHLEQYDLAGSERVHRLRKKRNSQFRLPLAVLEKERTERTTFAMRAQKKLLHIVLMGQLIVISWFRAKSDSVRFHGEYERRLTDFEREQDATDRTPERYGDSSCRRRRDDLPHLGCMLRRVRRAEGEHVDD
jgi:hypothetical protein